MKTNLIYGTKCKLTVVDKFSWHWELTDEFYMLQDAVNRAQDIFNDLSQFDSDRILVIFITDVKTGEVLAECKHDDMEEYDPRVEEIDNPNYKLNSITDWDN